MPVKSEAQYKLMQAAAHTAKGIGGLKPEVAKEFLRKTPEKKKSMFAKGK